MQQPDQQRTGQHTGRVQPDIRDLSAPTRNKQLQRFVRKRRQQPQQQGSLLGSLLGGSSGGSDLLSSFVNLLADNGSGRETPERKDPAGKAVKKAASAGTAKKAKTAGATPKAGGTKKNHRCRQEAGSHREKR